ncbi:MAG: histidinol-phosphatase [Sphaerochaetaceae bacterium]|nr:histidinol-phosphatase [Sphaerochaetaceae bacterium]
MVQIFPPERVNLHTHSWYCGHGVGELSEYVIAAEQQGLDVLGFSEHCPLPDHRWSSSRMEFDLLESYFEECRSLQRSVDSLQILIGLECDFYPEYATWYREFILEKQKVDFLCFGVHFLPNGFGKDVYLKHLPQEKRFLHKYTDLYTAGLSSGLFLFGVHPDLFASFYTSWDAEAIACSKEIIECAVTYNIPLEINGNGLRKSMIDTPAGRRHQYPLQEFWELAATYPVLVTTNSDAHQPNEVNQWQWESFAFANKCGVELCSCEVKNQKNSNLHEVALLPPQEERKVSNK